MKKYLKLLVALSLLIITSCVSKQKTEAPKLPPKPERMELAEPETLQDLAYILNYYEHLVEEWEEWGETAEALYELK